MLRNDGQKPEHLCNEKKNQCNSMTCNGLIKYLVSISVNTENDLFCVKVELVHRIAIIIKRPPQFLIGHNLLVGPSCVLWKYSAYR